MHSARNSIATRSCTGNDVISEKSHRACPSPRTPLNRRGETRMLFANCYAVFLLNPASVLNQRSTLP